MSGEVVEEEDGSSSAAQRGRRAGGGRLSGCSIGDEDEDDCLVGFLGKGVDQAEARLAARRQARAEAREIRMRELERQQKESEENADRVYDMYSEPVGRSGLRVSTPSSRSSSGIGNSAGVGSSVSIASPSYLSSRRSSEDSVDDGGSLGANTSIRDLRHELKELEEKFRKSMIQNAQLDNEKSALTYQVELLKDQIEEIEELHWQLQKEHKDKCREFEQLKRASIKLKEDMEFFKAQLEERDMLIQQHGLVIVADNEVLSDDDKDEDDSGDSKAKKEKGKPKKALVSVESAQMLQKAGEGSLDVRLRRFAEERNDLMDQVRHLKLELEEVQSRYGKGDRRGGSSSVGIISTGGQGGGSSNPVGGTLLNGPDLDVLDLQREANKQLADYKFKLQKAEQDVSTLQANVARLESQVIRYKSAADAAEKVEGELKSEKRKLQRELRESQTRLEELETSNNHLQRRLDKLKSAKSALLKDL